MQRQNNNVLKNNSCLLNRVTTCVLYQQSFNYTVKGTGGIWGGVQKGGKLPAA